MLRGKLLLVQEKTYICENLVQLVISLVRVEVDFRRKLLLGQEKPLFVRVLVRSGDFFGPSRSRF